MNVSISMESTLSEAVTSFRPRRQQIDPVLDFSAVSVFDEEYLRREALHDVLVSIHCSLLHSISELHDMSCLVSHLEVQLQM